MHIDPEVLALALTMVGMILFAVLLIIGSVRGIRAEQEELEKTSFAAAPAMKNNSCRHGITFTSSFTKSLKQKKNKDDAWNTR